MGINGVDDYYERLLFGGGGGGWWGSSAAIFAIFRQRLKTTMKASTFSSRLPFDQVLRGLTVAIWELLLQTEHYCRFCTFTRKRPPSVAKTHGPRRLLWTVRHKLGKWEPIKAFKNLTCSASEYYTLLLLHTLIPTSSNILKAKLLPMED